MNRLHIPLSYPDIKAVRVKDAFWTPMLKKVAEVTLRDVWDKYQADGTERNFLNIAGKTGKKEFFGTPWQDGMIYEIIRGAADLLTEYPDAAVEEKLDRYIEEVAAAQDASGDGYINTFTSIMLPDNRFGQNGGFLIMQHDLYNAGCLMDAGVHYYVSTGKKRLLQVAVNMTNYICSEIGYPPKKNIVPGTPMIEQATVKLYKLMRDNPGLAKELGADADAYYELSRFWIDYRGVHENRASFPKFMREYAQDHHPLKKQHEAVGHAVRAALVYTGMAAVANETGDEDIYEASLRLWENVTETKMHVTGGIGAMKEEERFGYQYELPSNAYLETCAGVALAFWAGEMHRTYGDASFFDVFERVLYNNILATLSEEGNKYTYVNPLLSEGDVERWSWHPCPCCPPMFLKIMGCLKSYIFSMQGQNLYLNLHIGAEASFGGTSVSYEKGVFTVKSDEELKVRIRIPEYVSDFTLLENGRKIAYTVEKGYAVIDKKVGEVLAVTVSYEEKIIREEPHPYVWENCYGFIHNTDRVVIRKGRFLYCAEGVDNDGDVDFTLSADAPLTEGENGFIVGTTTDGKTCRMIPYYRWNNRGNCKMRIWLKQEGMVHENIPDDNWAHKLYRPWRIEN